LLCSVILAIDLLRGPGMARAGLGPGAVRNADLPPIGGVAPLFETGCTRGKALKCWDKVFATTFFNDREQNSVKAAASLLNVASVAPMAGAFMFPSAPRFEFVCAGDGGEHEAFLCKQSGKLYCHSGLCDALDILPDDIADSEKCDF
jgi:hypothetical protein